jgi:hypothetical protein
MRTTSPANICALCGFTANGPEAFVKHATIAHGWAKQRGGGSVAAWMPALVVSCVAILMILVIFSGLGFIGYKYAPAVLARIYELIVLGVAAVVAFDVIVVVESGRRWRRRYLMTAEVVCLVVAAACLSVAATTGY